MVDKMEKDGGEGWWIRWRRVVDKVDKVDKDGG